MGRVMRTKQNAQGKRQTQGRGVLRGRHVTAQDVARSLGISISTVSRAFSQDVVIAETTRALVLKEAKRMGYTPNLLARGLITHRSSIAGIVVADITNPFYPEVLASLTQRLHENDLQSMVFCAGPSSDLDAALPTLLQYRPDVAVVLAATLSTAMLDACEHAGTPVILFNRYVNHTATDAVSCDNFGGGQLVADALLDAGHTRLAYIAGLAGTSTSRDRLNGFLSRIRERYGPAPYIENAGGFTYEGGFAALKRLMEREEPPQAVFCANDIVAIGALDAARADLGLRVPYDLSIVGFDDIAISSWPPYSLTTVRQPVPEMIEITIQKIKALLRDANYCQERVFVPGRLIRRASATLGDS